MTQSDSPDFEFDPSDLEVDGSSADPSENGETASENRQPKEPPEKASSRQSSDEEELTEEDLKGFAIDDMPEPFEPTASAEMPPVASESAVDASPAEPVGSDESSEAPVFEGTEPASPPKQESSWSVGADDLGADVFSEMDDDPESLSFEDAIDGLMDEVETYEAGGFVELADDDVQTVSDEDEDDGLFKLDDPDDSLGQQVDPSLEPEPEPAPKAAASFPTPPANYELPEEETYESPEQPAAESPAPEIAEAPPEVDVKDPEPQSVEPAAASPSDFSVPPDVSEMVIPADPGVEKSPPPTQASANPPMPVSESQAPEPPSLPTEIPADPVEPEQAVVPEESVFEEEAASLTPELIVEDDEPEPIDETETEESNDLGLSEETAEAVDIDSIDFMGEADESPAEEPVPAPVSESEPVEAVPELSVEPDEEAPAFEDDSVEIAEDEPALSVDDEEEEAVFADEPAVAEAPESEAIEDEAEPEEISEPAEEEEIVFEDADEEAAPAEEEAVPEAENEAVEVEEEEVEELAVPELTIEEDDDEEEEIVLGEEPSLAVESDEEEAVPVSEDDSEEVEGLSIIEDDEEEESAEPTPESETPTLEVESEDDEEDVVETPSAEDLLMQAGSLLNGGSAKPEQTAAELLKSLEEDEEDEEIVSLPSPDAVLEEVEDDEEEVVALPDPADLMSPSGEGLAVVLDDPEDDEDEDEEPIEGDGTPGNVADRAGDLPPPPPAPVEIIDDEPLEEDPEPEIAAVSDEEEVSLEEVPESEAEAESEMIQDDASEEEVESDAGLEDPFGSEISLDDFGDDLGDLEGFDESPDEETEATEAEESEETEAAASEKSEEAVAEVIEIARPGLLWRLTHSMAVAAGLVLIGLASVLGVWKQPILEYFEGRDLDGSSLVNHIKNLTNHALGEFNEDGLYQMQWIDSEVRQVSDTEIRLHARIAARLREDLFVPVLDSELGADFESIESRLEESLDYAHTHFPEGQGDAPSKPWNMLMRKTAPAGEVIALRVMYGLNRESPESEWEMGRIRVSGSQGDLAWPEGQPAIAFGEKAYDIQSEQFKEVIAGYRSRSENFVAKVERLKEEYRDERFALQRENAAKRQQVKMALAEGAFFSGVAILGQDADDSRDVRLVITEVRDEGAFLKGVVRMAGEEQDLSKQFVGSLDFETTYAGREQGVLNLRTVSFEAPETAAVETLFFDPSTVSDFRLEADGFRLEGDSRDLSLRLTRSM